MVHFAMPTMTAISFASYWFPAAPVFWGFHTSPVRPARDALLLPPWLDIFLVAFPRNLMAILAFVSGFSSKSELTVKRYEGVLLLILARILYGGLVSKAESHPGYMTNFAYPDFYGGHLWYLYALVIWRLAIQVFRPLYPAIGMIGALLISIFADRIFHDPEMSTWAVAGDWWALKKSASFFYAFAAGFYCPKEWPSKLRYPGVRLGAFCLQCTFYFLYSQGSFVDWYYSNVSDMTEMRAQNVQLNAAYDGDDIWQTRVLAVLFTVAQGFAAVGWLPHTVEWHTRYGAASLYPYVLHWHVLMFVLPHWDVAMLDFFPDDGARWVITYLIVLPVFVMLPLSGVLWRLLWWVLLEPTWARVAFNGRLGKLHDAYEERGLLHAWQLAVDELTPGGIKLTEPWMFGLWLTVALAFWVTVLTIFDPTAFVDCHNDNCKLAAQAYIWVILSMPEVYHINATSIQLRWTPRAVAYDHGDGFSSRNGEGLFIPGGGAFATFITVLLFLGLAFEVCLQVMPMLKSVQASGHDQVPKDVLRRRSPSAGPTFAAQPRERV